jgi:hypothetical protein
MCIDMEHVVVYCTHYVRHLAKLRQRILSMGPVESFIV